MALTVNAKTTRNLSQFAEKKLVGRSHTRADRSDLEEGIPSGMQLTTKTIFGETVPSSPADNVDQIQMWHTDANNIIQKVELTATAIIGTDYNAFSDPDGAGNDDNSPNNNGIHAYELSMVSDYVANSTVNSAYTHPKVNSGVFVDDQRVYDTLGTLQIVPDNMWFDPTFVNTNPYTPQIYYEDQNGVHAGIFGPTSAIDVFFDPYSGIIFLQDFDPDQIPYKVVCFIYVGDMANQATGGAATTLNGLNDVDVPSPTNGQVLAYNSGNSKWEAQNANTGGINRFEYIEQTGTSANTDITITGMNFTNISTSMADTHVFLNGQMLYRGTNTEVGNGVADYALGNQTIRFKYELDIDDVVAITHITTDFSNGKPFLTHVQDNSMNNAFVLDGGDGITIGPAVGTTMFVNNTGLVQRTKESFTNLTHAANVFTFNFVGNYHFGSSNHDDNRIDVFVDGLLKEEGLDYNFVSNGQGGYVDDQITWIGGSTPSTNARFTIIIF